MIRYFLPGLIAFFCFSLHAQHNTDSLLLVLDRAVEESTTYTLQKENSLSALKQELKNSSGSRYFHLCTVLYDNYKNYQYDSAMVYAHLSYRAALNLNCDSCIAIAHMKQAEIIGLNGIFKEAMAYMEQVDIRKYPGLRAMYFQVKRYLFTFNGNYLLSDNERALFDQLADSYTDSTLQAQLPDNTQSVLILADKLRAEKKYEEAAALLQKAFGNSSGNFQTIHTQAIVAHYLSGIYASLQNREEEKYWLIQSAINDMRSGTKEYISLRRLAFLLYEDGQTDRAYRYIRQTLEDALFCNARQRIYNISEVLHLIDKAYQDQVNARQREMLFSLISISLLSFFLLLAIWYVYRQMQRIKLARQALSQAYEQLKSSNRELLETNLIKEEYIGRYMDQCSEYIDKLDNYRRSLIKTYTVSPGIILNTLKSKQIIEDELKAFYHSFDTTFLQLFPSFREDLASLLTDNEDLSLKPGQLLNTEMRIFALQRLGIEDGIKLAHFLRCSASTIYNYRTKIRNKSKLPREEFDKQFMQIGN